MFAAIIFLMTFTPMGFIPLGVMNATIVHIPVIIGSVILGPGVGAFLGGLFGLASFIRATFSPTVTSFVFSPLIPIPGTQSGSVWALAVCFVPRILVGVTPYYVGKFMRGAVKGRAGTRLVPAFVSGISGSMTNTLLVMYLIYALFGDAYAAAGNIGSDAVIGAILTVVVTHGIPEALIAGIFTSAVCRALDSFMKSDRPER
jgi:uncharacterized membrane protein